MRLVRHLAKHRIPMAICSGSRDREFNLKVKNHKELTDLIPLQVNDVMNTLNCGIGSPVCQALLALVCHGGCFHRKLPLKYEANKLSTPKLQSGFCVRAVKKKFVKSLLGILKFLLELANCGFLRHGGNTRARRRGK